MLAVHLLQHSVATGLYRQVDVFADIAVGGHSVQHRIAHIFRVGGGESDSDIRIEERNFFEQKRKIYLFTRLGIYPEIAVNVLSEKIELFISVTYKCLSLSENAV